MNVRIVALALLLFAPAGLAQDYHQSARAKSAERAAMLESLQRGKEITALGERYQQLPGVLAVERSGSQTPREALGAANAGAAEVVETKGKLVLYRGGGSSPALVKRVGEATVYPTVVNSRTGTLGVLTGTLVVKPKSMGDADAIAAGHGLQKTKAYPRLNTVFYRAKPNVDIADVTAALQADPRIESAYPEIIEHVREPK
jgi:Open reading frame 2 N-terminal domain